MFVTGWLIRIVASIAHHPAWTIGVRLRNASYQRTVEPDHVAAMSAIYFGYRWMRSIFTGLLGLSLVLIGCSAAPGAISIPPVPLQTGAVPAPTLSASPPASVPTATDAVEPTVSTVEDPYAAGLMRVIELAGTPCLVERHAETDTETDIARLELDRLAADVLGPEGILPGTDVKAYVGSLRSAAKAFDSTEVLERSGGGRAVVIGRAAAVQDVPDGAPIGYVLVPVALKDGRTAWVRVGDYIASVPCSAEESPE